MTTESPVVFLDFDDVICLSEDGKPGCYDVIHATNEIKNGGSTMDDFHSMWEVLFDTQAVKNLLALHSEFSPRYVLSTSWTRMLDHAALSEVLTQCGLAFVVRSLHLDWETQKEPRSTRAQQIDGWLANNPDTEHWLALDDTYSGDGFEGSHRRVVLCEVGKGFREWELQKAHAVLKGDF